MVTPLPLVSYYTRTLLLPLAQSTRSIFSPVPVSLPLPSCIPCCPPLGRSTILSIIACVLALFMLPHSTCPPAVFLRLFFAAQIADFGFSALFRELETESSSGEDSSEAPSPAGTVRGSRALPPTVAVRARAAGVGAGVAGGGAGAGGTRGSGKTGLGRGVRRLTSVVGSPYYVAPEVRGCGILLPVLWCVL